MGLRAFCVRVVSGVMIKAGETAYSRHGHRFGLPSEKSRFGRLDV